jgi:hypothetical protein
MFSSQCCRKLLSEIRDPEAIKQEASFYSASTDSGDLCPKTEPGEQSFLTLFTLESRLQKQKAKSNTYVAIFIFIGYFTLVLRDLFPFPVLCDLLHVQIPQVFSLWCAIPTSLMLHQDSGLVFFFLIFLPAKITYLRLLLSFITCNYQYEALNLFHFEGSFSL